MFLKGRDTRWKVLLANIELLRGKPVKQNNEEEWSLALKPTPMDQWKEQLFAYFMNFLKGQAKSQAETNDVKGALDTWRQMADKGHSQR